MPFINELVILFTSTIFTLSFTGCVPESITADDYDCAGGVCVNVNIETPDGATCENPEPYIIRFEEAFNADVVLVSVDGRIVERRARSLVMLPLIAGSNR